MVKVACSLAAVLLLVSSGAAYSRSQASPTTLVLAKGEIFAFAQDGNQIAWASYGTGDRSDCARQVRIGLLGSKQQKLVTKRTGPTCNSRDRFRSGFYEDMPVFALAGERALWTMEGFKVTKGTYVSYQNPVAASYSDTRDVGLKSYKNDPSKEAGDVLVGISGDSSTLVYGVTTVGGSPNCRYDDTCVILDGGVFRVVGTSEVAVPGAPPPAMLAASGNAVAIVVAERVRYWSDVLSGLPAHVTVIDAVTGASIGSFSPKERPTAIAFAPSVVAVLESVSGTKAGAQIEFYTPAGALLRTVAVPLWPTGLSTTNTRAVFRVGKSIRTVSVATGDITTVATAANAPIGLSIEGTRVAWAENVKIRGVYRGRIRAITVR
jgi:hypothetical protein